MVTHGPPPPRQTQMSSRRCEYLCMRTNIRSIRRTIRNRRGTSRKCSRCLGHHDDEAAASTLVLVEASHKQIHSLTFHISRVSANSHSPRNLFSPVQSAHNMVYSIYLYSLTTHVPFTTSPLRFMFSVHQLFLFLFFPVCSSSLSRLDLPHCAIPL